MSFYVRVLGYFRRDLWLIAALVVLILLSLGVGLLLVWPPGIIVDTVLDPRQNNDWVHRLFRASLAPLPQTPVAQMVGVAVIGLLLKVIQDTTTLLRNMINKRLGYGGAARVRQDLFDKLQHLSPAYHRARPQGDAIYRLTTDALGFFGVLDTFIGAAVSCLTLVLVARVLWSLSVTMMLIAFAATPLLVLLTWHFGRTIRRTSLESKQTDTDLTTFIQRAMSGVLMTQLFGRQDRESRRFGQTVDRTVRAGMRMSWQQELFPLAVQAVFAVGIAVVLAFGGWLVWRDKARGTPNGFTVGALLACIGYLMQMWEPIRRIIGFPADVQTNAAACARVFAVLDLEPDVADPPDAVHLPVQPRALELRDVSFAYGPDRPILRGVTAAIRPGEMVAFIGPSGAGKSTLLNLLPRFYDPSMGSVALDGYDLRWLRVADVRRHVALVPQENTLLAASIAENIAYGRPDATPEEVRAAAELAGAAEFIDPLPDGYDTQITESAANLSGGQRQRLAIARALLTESPILVLDEPTSALDPSHEQQILRTLRRLKGRRTLVLVTHRLETVADCDRVYVLDAGRVVEEGTPAALAAAGGPFAAMAATAAGAQQRHEEAA